MKKYQLIITSLVAFGLFSCNEPAYIDAPGVNSHNQDSLPVLVDPDPTPDPEGFAMPDGTINVYEAVRISKKLKDKEVSDQKYFIKGWVTGFNRGNTFDSDFPRYGNDFVYISATNDGSSSKQFYAYRVLGKFGAKLPDLDCVQIGDFVVISCYPMNYGGTYESSGACFIYLSNNEHFNEVFPAFPGCPEPKAGEISVTEAEKVIMAMESRATTTEDYRVRGVVVSTETTSLGSYGNITFNISDGMSYATCYQTYAKTANGKFTDLNQVLVGDTVLIIGKLQNYSGTCEPYRAYVAESSNPNFNEAFPPIDTIYATCSEAKTAALALARGTTGKDLYIIEGYVQSAGYNATVSRNQQTFWLDDTPDGGKVVQSYWGNVPDGQAVAVGTKIRLTGFLMNYNGTAEVKNGDIEILSE